MSEESQKFQSPFLERMHGAATAANSRICIVTAVPDGDMVICVVGPEALEVASAQTDEGVTIIAGPKNDMAPQLVWRLSRADVQRLIDQLITTLRSM